MVVHHQLDHSRRFQHWHSRNRAGEREGGLQMAGLLREPSAPTLHGAIRIATPQMVFTLDMVSLNTWL